MIVMNRVLLLFYYRYARLSCLNCTVIGFSASEKKMSYFSVTFCSTFVPEIFKYTKAISSLFIIFLLFILGL